MKWLMENLVGVLLALALMGVGAVGTALYASHAELAVLQSTVSSMQADRAEIGALKLAIVAIQADKNKDADQDRQIADQGRQIRSFWKFATFTFTEINRLRHWANKDDTEWPKID